MRRKIFIIFSIVIFLVLSLFFYFQKVFLPTQLKKIVVTKVQELLDRPVKIDQIDYSLRKGIYLKNIIIFEKEAVEKAFVTIEEISFKFLLPSLFKNKGFIIPSLVIYKPEFNIVHQDNAEFNFSDIIQKFKQRPASSPSSTLLIGHIDLNHGQLDFMDIRRNRQETIKDIDIKAMASLPKAIQLAFNGTIASSQTPLQLNGDYAIDKKILNLKLNLTTFDLAKYLPLFYENDNVLVHNGVIQQADITLNYKKDDLQLSGTFDISNIDAMLLNDQTLKGHLVANPLTIQWKDKILTIKGNWATNETQLNLNNNQNFQGNLKATDFALRRDQTQLEVKGNLELTHGHMNLSDNRNFLGSINLKDGLLIKSPEGVEIKTSLEGRELFIQWGEEQKFIGDIRSPKTVLKIYGPKKELNTSLSVEKAQLDLPLNRTFKGNATITLSLQLDPTQTEPLTYSGSAEIEQGSLTGIPNIQQLTAIQGRLNFETNKIQTERLNLATLDSAITLSGSVENFKNPVLNANFQSDKIDLNRLASLFPDFLTKVNITTTGQAAINGHYKGPMASWTEADIQLKTKIKETSLHLKQFNETITGLNGELQISPNQMSLKNLQGIFREQKFTLDGSLVNFKQPSIDATLSSDDLNLTSQIDIQEKEIQILSLRGYYLDSTIDVKGDISLDGVPRGDLKGDFDINLEDLGTLTPTFEKKLEEIKPVGIVSLDVRLQGPLQDWTSWQLIVSGQSSSLSLYGLHADTVNLYYDQRNKFINEGKITANFYDGQLILSSSGDLNRDDQPFFISLMLNNTSLAKLKHDTPLKNKELAGMLKAGASLNGSLKNIPRLQGQGFVTIRDGHLWQFNLFKGLWEALLIPEFVDVVFTDAHADFQIKNQRIATPNLNFKSRQVELNGRGSLDFKGNINLDVSPTFSEITILESDSPFKKVPASVLSKTSDVLTIKITGTLQNPKYLPITDPSKIIKKATGAIWQGIEDIFSEIF